MGNRAWKNTDKLNSLFLARYDSDPERVIFTDVKPDHLSSSLFYPMIEILRSQTRLLSIPIGYHHPKNQTDFENNNPEYKLKRDEQRNMLKHEMVEFVRQVLDKPSSIKPV